MKNFFFTLFLISCMFVASNGKVHSIDRENNNNFYKIRHLILVASSQCSNFHFKIKLLKRDLLLSLENNIFPIDKFLKSPKFVVSTNILNKRDNSGFIYDNQLVLLKKPGIYDLEIFISDTFGPNSVSVNPILVN